MNDMVASFITLFCVMISNWSSTIDLYTGVTGNYFGVQVYFVSFYFFSTIIIMNILVAFTIDVYLKINSIQRLKD